MQTKVSTKGQVVLPGPLRRRLDIRASDPLDANIKGWEYCIDAAQETGSSSKTCDGSGYRTPGSERGPKRADIEQQGS